MSVKETAILAKNMHGEELYQKRARDALPILVRQAKAGKTLFYEDLAQELGMPNPRNLNYVLGSVGQSLIELQSRWDSGDIPPIQCLVVNQKDKLPGEGFGWFMPDASQWRTMSKLERRKRVDTVTSSIALYGLWDEVLRAENLSPVTLDYRGVIAKASSIGGGGESEDHARLKAFVAQNPSVISLADKRQLGAMEKALPSGDRMDVFFDTRDEWIGVEVKSARSGPEDLVRGLFQCVKYQAVLRAMLQAEQVEKDARAVLVLEGELPAHLVPLKRILGVEVIEHVRPLR